jgi:LysM repeat protein
MGKRRSPCQITLTGRKRGRIIAPKLILIALVLSFLFCPVPVPGAEKEVETHLLSQFDIFEADIRDVFRSLAELGDLNVLLDRDVQGLVTINLKHGLKISEAIELLARTYGYSYRWIIPRRTVIIGTDKTFADWDARETRVYRLRYAASREVVAALGVVIPPERIGVDARTNQLTIHANALEHHNIEEIIARLDRRMPQINIEARVEEISLTATKALGISWEFAGFDIETRPSLRFSLVDVQTLHLMEEEGVARIIANPNISTTDGKEGRIFIGDRLPVITIKVKDGQIEDEVTYIEAGTILTVEPQINDERTITVKVKAEVSNIVGWRTGRTGTEVPVVRTREATSVVRLKEGETFVLSGLNLQQDTETMTSVPFVSRLPFFGRLFQKQTKEPWEETEICIFLTPYVVREEDDKPRRGVGKGPAVKGVDLEVVWPGTGKQDGAKNQVQAGVEEEASGATGIVIALPEEETTAVPEIVEIREITEAEVTTEPRESMETLTAATEPEKSIETLEPAEPQETAGTPAIAETRESPEPTETKGEPEEAAWTELGGKRYDEEIRDLSPVKEEEKKEERAAEEVKPGLRLAYQVQAGDTVAAIARKYGITPASILAENKGAEKIYPGQTLLLPIPESHLYPLKAGETIWRLAKRYGTTVELLMEINGIADVTVLKTGRMIILPRPADQIADDRF